MNNIDIDQLISLVEERPVLWDKTLDVYKDRNATKNAWEHICRELNNVYDLMDEKNKNDYGKEVAKKWGNIRDSFQKSEKQAQLLKKSGSGRSAQKSYIYRQQLHFLRKTFEERPTEDSLSENIQQRRTTDSSSEVIPEGYICNTNENDTQRPNDSSSFKTPGSRKRKVENFELELINAIKEKPDRHLSFFRGIIPSLHTFNEDEILEFQMSVLQKVVDIKQRKNISTNIPHTSGRPHMEDPTIHIGHRLKLQVVPTET